MPSKKDKIILGAAGAVGAGIMSWRAFYPWIGYDLKMMKHGKKASSSVMKDIQNQRFLINMFEEAVEKYPKKPFIIFEDRVYTYEFVCEQTNRVANIAVQWGFKVGECVALMIENEPAFIWTFLGLQKLGIAVAFININISGDPLVHTLRACEAKALIIGQGDNILHKVEEIRGELGDLPRYVQGPNLLLGAGYVSWDELMRTTLPVPMCRNVRAGLGLSYICCYIFTSGTTGLPKPAIITQQKAISLSKFFQLFDFLPTDIVYIVCLYHVAAGGVGLMATIDQGATMVLSRKFSSQRFFEDIRRHNVTVLQYIGELCRYVLSVPKNPLDSKHCVRVAVGNGLRADIWETFKTRFNIPNICEFFGATEEQIGPYPKAACEGRRGYREVIRNTHGFCIPVGIGETGLFLGGIPPNYANLKFYKGNQDVNEKKLLRNVVREGDVFFNFGDLLSLDKDYFVYFRDRVGDTFRWKGENVATFEVSSVISKLPIIQDANGSEGRAGMAAIHLEDDKEPTAAILKDIFQHCKENLPSYARPLFLRFPKEAAITVTMKQQKTQFRNDGFHPQNIPDPLFYYNESAKTYSPLTMDNIQQFLTKSRL